jgi:beta-glucanase (GH16 family)
MKILKFILLALIVIITMFFTVGQSQQGYKLVWADEFDKDRLPDASKWTYETGLVRNHELQWYQPQNARCENGNLIIEAQRVRKRNPLYEPGSSDWRKQSDSLHYTAACLVTKGLHAWKYGRFVMRGRIDIRKGLWPAWWTLGVNKNWPACGEIDMMEYYRKTLLANIACLAKDGSPEWFSKRFNTDSLGGEKWASQFHIWRMDWDKNSIALYIDDQLLNKVPLDALVNKDGSGFNPFNQPHYMLLNLAIGGDNGGNPDATSFPAKFEIDYVRVYQK